jgi:hypothetical protein
VKIPFLRRTELLWVGPLRPTEDPAGLPYKLVKRKQMLIVETEKFFMKNSLISEKIMQKIWKIRINPIHLQG